MKYAAELSDMDRKLAESKLKDFVPDEIYDIHIHPVNPAHFPVGTYQFLPDHPLGCEVHRAALRRYMPSRLVHGLYFGLPNPAGDRPALNEWISKEVRDFGTAISRVLLVVSPADDKDSVAKELRSGTYAGLKVYHSFVQHPDTMQTRVSDYAPDWMWEILNEVRGVLMLHLVRDDAIADGQNQQDLRRLCREYPAVRVILAHIGRSFNYRHARAGLWRVADLENVMVDTSAIAEADAFRVAFDVMGPQRVLWGSDYPMSETRGRCVATGTKFYWLHPEWVRLNVLSGMTLVGIESLLCLREACEDRGLTQSDINDLFYNNAARWLNLAVKNAASVSSPEARLRVAGDR